MKQVWIVFHGRNFEMVFALADQAKEYCAFRNWKSGTENYTYDAYTINNEFDPSAFIEVPPGYVATVTKVSA